MRTARIALDDGVDIFFSTPFFPLGSVLQ